jgi:hypothetical protein
LTPIIAVTVAEIRAQALPRSEDDEPPLIIAVSNRAFGAAELSRLLKKLLDKDGG